MGHPLHHTATGRDGSLFAADLAARHHELTSIFKGARVLVIGGAGSIGSNTIHTLVEYGPAALHVVDQNENELAELVRQLRSRSTPMDVADFRTLPLDYGSAAMRAFMAEAGPYDRILNFAAIKHVRSEKDVFSILQMFDTNIVKQARFRRWIGETSPKADYFGVSTDKAANPVSFMGATKRIMEHVLFADPDSDGLTGRINTARFANVAYSNGSLLKAFTHRLERGEPLAAPQGIRRYFVSLQESGHICTLASAFAPHAHIAIPDLDPEEHLVTLQSVAENFLAHHGLTPRHFEDEAEAIKAVAACHASGEYPLLLTPGNTAGEKPYEEFVGEGETVSNIGLKAMKAVPHSGTPDALASVLERMAAVVAGDDAGGKSDLKGLIAECEPAFARAHIDSRFNLDQRV